MGSDSSMVSGAWAPCLNSFGCTIVTPFAKFYETAILHKNLDLEIDIVLDGFSDLAISAFNSVDQGKCNVHQCANMTN